MGCDHAQLLMFSLHYRKNGGSSETSRTGVTGYLSLLIYDFCLIAG